MAGDPTRTDAPDPDPLIDDTPVLLSWDDGDADTLDVVILRDTVTELAVPLTDDLVDETFDALAQLPDDEDPDR